MESNQSATDVAYYTVATAGHVDHGKTSLLKGLTGQDPDRLKEEKERQMTTDLGFAHLKLPQGVTVGFIDVPGHGKFLKNMLAGVGGIDLSLLVVAADEGPMPQTEQHTKILSLLGSQSVLVAITKTDTVNAERLPVVKALVEQLLVRFGLQSVGWVYISNTRLEGFEELRATLSTCLNRLPARDRSGSAFLPVDRVFSKAGFGVVITGTLVKGRLCVGDNVWLEPGAIRARVRRLETFGQSLKSAGPGQRLACNLVLKENASLVRGHVVTGTDVSSTTSLLVGLAGWSDEMGPRKLDRMPGQAARVYHGTAEYHGRVAWVEEPDIGSTAAIAHVSLSNPAIVEPGDRFVLRLGDDTICGGTIALADKPRWLTRKPAREVVGALLSGNYHQASLSFIGQAPLRMVKIDQLEKAIPPGVRARVLEELVAGGSIVQLSDYLLTSKQLSELEARILQEMKGPPPALEHLRSRILPGLDRSVFQALVQAMQDAGQVVRRGDKLTLPEVAVTTGGDSHLDALATAILSELENHLCLELAELAKICNAPVQSVKAAVEKLALSKQADIVNYDFAASRAQLRRAHQVLGELWNDKHEINPGDFRELMGTSRKYAMPLLSYFDDQKITRRLPEGRILLKRPE